MKTLAPVIEGNADGLAAAINDSANDGLGFVEDLAPELIKPIQTVANRLSIGFFEDIDPRNTSVIPEVLALRGLLLAGTQAEDSSSNLGYGHVFTRSRSGVPRHQDVSADPDEMPDYKMGKYRVGYNVSGAVEINYRTPLGKEKQRVIKPGDAYVINLFHNPVHGSKLVPSNSLEEIKSSVLIMTDVAERLTQ